VYSEMKMCLAPCYKGCTDERYAEEAAAVESFLATRGESRLVVLRSERDAASANLEFEDAAALHAQVQKVESVRALAPELVRPMNKLRAVILQPAGPVAPSTPAPEVSVFLFENGRFRGPVAFSTMGMRIQNEQSGSSSLFAQPMTLEPVPEAGEQGSENRDQGSGITAKAARTMLETRMESVIAELMRESGPPSATIRQGHLALLKRWYYRPEVKRMGEIFFPDAEERWPVKAMLRGVGRVAAKMLAHSELA
jgi:excinuclease ABC subunit C